MTTLYVSTPRFTVLVELDHAGIIRATAPYLRRTWPGKPWAVLRGWLERRYGTALRVATLVEA